MRPTTLCRILLIFSLTASAAVQPTRGEEAVEPRQQAIVDRMGTLRNDFLHSSDLRLRVIFSAGDFEQAPDGAMVQRPLIATATLAEQALGSTDPVILDLLSRRCRSATADCDRLTLLRRWTEVDTQNQLAWISLASALKFGGDAESGRRIFIRAAQASTWHDHYSDVARIVAHAMPADLTPDQRYGGLEMSAAIAGTALPFDAVQALGIYCKENDAVVQDACRRILRTMVRDSDTVFELTVAPAFAIRAGLARDIVTGYQQKSDAIHWAMRRWSFDIFRPDQPDPTQIAARTSVFERWLADGEVRSAERLLIERHISETEAASLYVASLSSAQAARRAEIRGSY